MNLMNQLVSFSIYLTFTIFITSCSENKSQSLQDQDKVEKTPGCFSIVNGKATSKYPSVVYLANKKGTSGLWGGCTGVFVGRNVILTAAHCARNSQENKVKYIPGNNFDLKNIEKIWETGISPIKTIAGRLKDSGDRTHSINESVEDFSVLIFDGNVAPGISPIATSAGEIGSSVTIVGFGILEINGVDEVKTVPESNNETSIKKRFGKNSLVDFPGRNQAPKGLLFLFGDKNLSESKNQSLASEGDSGGPMLLNDRVLGIASVVDTLSADEFDVFGKHEAFNTYVDVNSEVAKSLLGEAINFGADVRYEGETDQDCGTK